MCRPLSASTVMLSAGMLRLEHFTSMRSSYVGTIGC